MVPEPLPDWFELRRARKRKRARAPKETRAPAQSEPAAPPPSFPLCVDETDPCWYARCRYSLLTDQEGRTGIRETFPGVPITKLEQTCALRAARDGVLEDNQFRDHSVPEIAQLMSMSPQLVRITLMSAFAKIAQVIEPGKLVRYWKAKRAQNNK